MFSYSAYQITAKESIDMEVKSSFYYKVILLSSSVYAGRIEWRLKHHSPIVR